ncbi:BAK_1a_G0012670.mRNA.1.CDS.1 [Saccharomyces cerevisiae]|nr:BAK_1a_G0012670.mRNA.1.CDS.1 [Saccharomyces cerevisiae]CAI7082900.1 BAK_1a_G0012670.mRNA.1.CDS.1 [Saccharomyces cerevisiae]
MPYKINRMKNSLEINETEGTLLVDERKRLRIGELYRYKFSVNKDVIKEQGLDVSHLFLRIKNEESALLRPLYLTGPYSFYIDVRPHNYNENRKFPGKEIIPFVENLKPDERFKVKILLNENSRVGDTSLYSWTIDIISQLAVTTIPKLEFSFRIGTTRKVVKKSNGLFKSIEGVSLEMWDTETLWDLPPKFPEKPVHLVIMTHGIFSNIGCDMLYMKDKIEEMTFPMDESINPNIIVRGFMGNVGKSGHGIHCLGVRVGKYVLETVDKLNKKYKVDRISFIGHSLGGPTQSMAVRYISIKRPDFFDAVKGVKPVNFITLASPFIGVIGDFPFYLSVPLDMGALGLTGRDLNLKYTPLTSKDGLYADDEVYPEHSKYILEILPQAPAKKVFESFKRRTIYANVMDDGIVPLRTAALLYLDWRSIHKVQKIRKKNKNSPTSGEFVSSDSPESSAASSPSNGNGNNVGEIPAESPNKKATLQWTLPQAVIHGSKINKYKRGQTNEANSDSDNEQGVFLDGQKFEPPKEANTVLSALSVLTAAIPDQEYIKNPAVRKDEVIHDKLYHPEELPPPHYENRPIVKKLIYPNESVNRIQERIAREWQETMTWRKVLVQIQPDSHNNIVVRRRFVNLYGYVAVEHMVEHHFGSKVCSELAEDANEPKDEPNQSPQADPSNEYNEGEISKGAENAT